MAIAACSAFRGATGALTGTTAADAGLCAVTGALAHDCSAVDTAAARNESVAAGSPAAMSFGLGDSQVAAVLARSVTSGSVNAVDR